MIDGQLTPEPWSIGDNIPWNDPGFSDAMLKDHLSQEHDCASRRFETIDLHVRWINNTVLSKHPSRILDLGCGPGLYLQRLALFGHECSGIDYSPASIAYARERSAQAELRICYVLEDMREADYGSNWDLIMLVYGEFNVFRPHDAELILTKCVSALEHGGSLLLEVGTFDEIWARGHKPSSRSESRSDFFVRDNFWDASRRVATERDTATNKTTGSTTVEGVSYQAYTDAEYVDLLKRFGFKTVRKYPSLTEETDDWSKNYVVFVAEKQDEKQVETTRRIAFLTSDIGAEPKEPQPKAATTWRKH